MQQFPFELKHLRSFVVLAETLNYHQTAEQLFVTQPALTKQIQNIGNSIGIKLLLRNGKGTTLTQEGKLFHEYAWSIIHEVERAISAMNKNNCNSRSLRIGFTDIILNNNFRHFLTNFHKIESSFSIFLQEAVVMS